MHLGGRHEFSTFRRTLGSIVVHARGEQTIDEAQVTAWMHAHLKVVAVPFDDADSLGQLEEDVLRRLAPFNLEGMAESPIWSRLKELRKPHAATVTAAMAVPPRVGWAEPGFCQETGSPIPPSGRSIGRRRARRVRGKTCLAASGRVPRDGDF
jgi:hypothetical protein